MVCSRTRISHIVVAVGPFQSVSELLCLIDGISVCYLEAIGSRFQFAKQFRQRLWWRARGFDIGALFEFSRDLLFSPTPFCS